MVLSVRLAVNIKLGILIFINNDTLDSQLTTIREDQVGFTLKIQLKTRYVALDDIPATVISISDIC